MSNPDLFNTFTARGIPRVTPSDTTDLPVFARSLRCIANGGAVRITAGDDQEYDTIIQTGTVLLCQVKRVHATGTAAGIVLEAMI